MKQDLHAAKLLKRTPKQSVGICWYYPFLVTILNFVFIACGSCHFLLFLVHSSCSIFDMFFYRHRLSTHKHIQTNTQKHIFTCRTEKESKKCTVLKPQITMFCGNAFSGVTGFIYIYLYQSTQNSLNGRGTTMKRIKLLCIISKIYELCLLLMSPGQDVKMALRRELRKQQHRVIAYRRNVNGDYLGTLITHSTLSPSFWKASVICFAS